MTETGRRYTTSGEQGQVGLSQAADQWRALVGIRATLRRAVLVDRATAIQNRAPQLTWPEAVDQAMLEVGLVVSLTPGALEDDPVIDPYPNL